MLARTFALCTFLFLNLFSLYLSCEAAVILQYHHVSDTTPKSTSISPAQFEKHLQYLTDHQFNVIPLPELVQAIKNKQQLPDKTVAITFDDAYTNILIQAKPLLDKYNFAYTIFVNPSLVSATSSHYLSWEQLSMLATSPKNPVTIANHGLEHNSFARAPQGEAEQMWFEQQTQDLLLAESLIKKHTGQTWKYFAYPYGEYTPKLQTWLKQQGYIAFSQQSGAVNEHTELTAIPRFPASQPYDKLSSLKDKLYSLPLNLTVTGTQSLEQFKQNSNQSTVSKQPTQTIFRVNTVNSVSFDVNNKDFYQKSLNCYISGLGKQKIEWVTPEQFTINFSGALPIGRVRANCTAPSISKPGRYYWFSHPWFILHADGTWYPL